MGNSATLPHRRGVVVSPGLWRGFDVEVFPPSQGHAARHFRLYSDAIEHAQMLRRTHGWPVVDNTSDDDGPRAA